MKKILIFVLLLGIIGWLVYPRIKNAIITPKADSVLCDTVPLIINEGQVFIEAKLEGYPMRFILDTGCSSVRIGMTEYLFLYKQGMIKSQPLDTITTINADGDRREALSMKMNIEIGGKQINGVNVMVGTNISTDDSPLLGHEVLEKLGTIQIDYKNKILIINK